MNNYVIDSSVFAKLLLNEDDSSKVEDLICKIIKEGDYILVPSIFSYEIVGIFKKHNFPIYIIKDFVKRYNNNAYLKVINIDDEILDLALDITTKGNKKSGFPSFYDATYHALAILNDCDFITADKKHYEKTKRLGNVQLL